VEQINDSSDRSEKTFFQPVSIEPIDTFVTASTVQERVDTKPTEKVAEKPKPRWLASLPIMTLLAVVFYAQGRMFTEAYLDYFGLNSSQFPVAADDAYWYALLGWSMVAGKGPFALWHIYPRYLLAEWPQLALTALVPLVGYLGVKFSWWKKISAAKQRLNSKLKIARYFGKPKPDVVRRVAYGGLPTLFLVSIPLIFMVVTVCLALLIYLVVWPFWGLGRKDAISDCNTPAADHAVVHYVGEPTTGNVARLLQCGPNFCAIIRDGEAIAIPRSAVQSVSGGVIGRKASNSPVPENQRLCVIPTARKNS
jgi:hypothetical protein